LQTLVICNSINIKPNKWVDVYCYSAYARSLYYFITGTKLDSGIPVRIDLSQRQAKDKVSHSVEKEMVQISPNPVQNHLLIQNGGDQDMYVMVTNLDNSVIEQISIEAGDKTLIDTQIWNQGLFVITITDGEEVIKIEKILKL